MTALLPTTQFVVGLKAGLSELSDAQRVYQSAHTAGQVRRSAQRVCAASTSNPLKRREVYYFADGSRIVITGNRVRIDHD